jgi:hypothetical protein
MDVALELEVGSVLPLASFPDGLADTLADPQGQYFFKKPQSIYNVLLDIRPSPGFDVALTLLLNNFTIHASLAYHPQATMRISNFAIAQLEGQRLPPLAQKVYLKNLLERNKVGAPSYEQSIFDKTYRFTDPPRWLFSRLNVGYRWYLLDYRLRPYVPLGIGIGLFNENKNTHWGFSFLMGLGGEYRMSDKLDVGMRLQYEWLGFILTQNFKTQVAWESMVASASAGKGALNAFLESFHSLQLGLTTTYHF